MCPPGAVSGRKDGGAACDGLMELKHCGPPLGRRAGVVQESSFDGDKPLPKTPQKILQPVTVVLPEPPTPKSRARNVRRGRVYAPDTTRNAERSIGPFALKAIARQPPLRGGLSIVATFELGVPASWPRCKRKAAIIGDICPTGRPDILDNLMKLLRDGLTGVVLDNDAQLVELCAFKKIRHRSEDRCDPQIDLRRAPDFRESGGDTVGIGQS